MVSSPVLRTAVVLVALALLAPGCGDGAARLDAGLDAEPGDPSEALFDPDRLLQVSITLTPADWDQLRYQHQPAEVVFGEDCLSGPAPRPYTYFAADVVIDGVALDQVGLRKKGFLGSANAQRPSLKIKFDEYVAGQEYSGQDRITLNNNQQDGSQLNQCLAYATFAAAGVPAPRCNFAHVTVNGVDLGIYSHVEPIRKPFLARHFADPEGNLYEGAISDFRPDWVNTFQRKNNRADPDRSDLDAVVAAAAVADDQFEAALAEVVDVDRLISQWAAEALVGHWDSYSNNLNNYYVYHDPRSGRFTLIPWGPDSAFGGDDVFARFDPPPGLYANGVLVHRLYGLATGRERYLDRLAELLDTVWDESALLAEIDRMVDLIGTPAQLSAETFEAEVDRVRDFVTGRRAAVEATLADGGPDWDHPLRSSMCSQVIGRVDGTFTAPWGEFQPAIPFNNPATLTVELDGATPALSLVGAGAGPSDRVGGARNGVAIYGLREDDGKVLVPAGFVDPELFLPGAELPIDGYAVFGVMVSAGINGSGERVVGFLSGTLTLDQATTTSGDPVSGTIAADVIGPKFWQDE